MAGKGRGVAAFTFNIEALGIGRGSMPEARLGPSPLYPNTEFKPLPLKIGEDEDYMMALKQEMRGTMQRLPHNIKVQSNRAEVEKYTARYLKQSQLEHDGWTPDWNRFPKELMPRTKKTQTQGKKKKSVKSSSKEATDVLSKLDELAKKDEGNDEKSDDEAEKKPTNEDDEEVEEEEYEEEDIEEDNDYIESYFDNGEDFAPDSDDNMDAEATY